MKTVSKEENWRNNYNEISGGIVNKEEDQIAGETLTSADGVTITGLDIPFTDLILTMVKVSFASIPAIFIISLIWWFVTTIFGSIFFKLIL